MAASRPIDAREFRAVCSRFVTGVCVVTSFGPEAPSGMTANAVASLSLVPPLMIVCFDRTSRTLAAVEDSGRLAIQFLAHDQEEIARRFASKLPEAEKFEGLDWSDRNGVPALGGSLAGLGCELRELLEGGDHLIGIAEVVDLWSAEGDPLVFFEGDYWALTDREPAPPEVDEALEGP
jgi:3-hydroxy-9,10-secoandrosta-1,3,5(10)-triene-9,17-dione monooxygenase reductase component